VCVCCYKLCTIILTVPSIVLTLFLGLISLFMTLAQPLFQISLATGYGDDLEPCKDNGVLTDIVCVVYVVVVFRYRK